MRIVAFIPARAGSKGVKRKNVRLVAGRPLIEYSLECALASGKIDDVVVTTNCPETKAIAKGFPVMLVERPDELAQDETPTYPVIEHALACYEGNRGAVDVVLLLQCTSPMRTAAHIDEALALFDDPQVAAVTSVILVGDEHPARMYRIDGGRLAPLAPELERVRRQDLPPVYRRNGAIYAMRRADMLEQQTLIGRNAAPYVMPLELSINIDTEIDLALADLLISKARVGA